MKLAQQNAILDWCDGEVFLKFENDIDVVVTDKSNVVWANRDSPNLEGKSKFSDYMRWWHREYPEETIAVEVRSATVRETGLRELQFTHLHIVLPLPKDRK